MAQIDMCGNATAYLAQNAKGAVSDRVVYSINQATIALEDAYRVVARGEDDEQ